MQNDYINYFEEQRKFYDNLDNQTKNQPQKKEESPKNQKEEKEQITKQSAQTFKNLAEYYNDKGEDKLIADIYNSVKQQKQAGKLNNAQITQFAKNISPMLNARQKEKLDALVAQLTEL